MSAAVAKTGAVFVGSKRMTLRDRDLIGEGGEGRVYRAGDLAVKVFTAPDAARERKLRAFPLRLPPRVVAPIDLVTDGRGAVVGFSMRALDGAVDLHRFSQRRWRAGQVTSNAVLALFRELDDTVTRLHARGIVVGDLNDGNVVVTAPPPGETAWTPWLIDADSMQFGAHACVVAHERFLDPRLYGVDLSQETALTRESDWYALAVLLFGSLLYVHPFGGSHPAHATMLRRAEARCSALRCDVKLPAVAVRPDVLPDDALAWFEHVFEKDLREPLPARLLDARFTACSCGVEHARTSCPACTARVHVTTARTPVRACGRMRATHVFGTHRGRIVAAAHDGTLSYVYEEAGTLRREDGSTILRRDEAGDGAVPAASFFGDPNRIVRVAGNATWLGARGRMWKIVAERVVGSVPVGTVRGELAADAGVAGLVHVHGDALVRAESGTRVGLVLEGQTFVRVGSTLGFAYYRAGDVTVAFVFDPQRGALRQIERFPSITGKIVGWSVVFDETHALVTFATEDRGRARYVTHLVDARGELVATDDSDQNAVLEPTLHGRALAGGAVLTATDDGLVLFLADRRTGRLARSREFPDARGLVSADGELIVGPGGSVFSVTHDEITHLSFVP